MIRVLGERLTQGVVQASGVLSVLTVLSWLIPPAAFLLSGTPAALVTLRRGPRIGLQVIAGSAVLLLGISALAGLGPELTTGYVVGIWAPAWLCAAVLRYTESQALMLLSAGMFGMCAVIATHLWLGDVTLWWQSTLSAWLKTSVTPELAQQYANALEPALPLINALMISALVVSIGLTVLAGRWWQARLFNPGVFRLEFHGLRLPRVLVVPTAMAIGLLVFGAGPWQAVVRDLLVVMLFVYLFQGIAAAHRTVAKRGLSRGWLYMMYSLLILVPHMLLFLSCLGMADSLAGGEARSG